MIEHAVKRLFSLSGSHIKITPAMSHILKANALHEYRFYKEALIEAEKARDVPNASVTEVELAKGKIVELLTEMEHEKTSVPKP